MNLEKEIFEISLNDIMPNRFQPREIFDNDALTELSQSIKEHGVIQPIIVRKVGDKYEIVAGERRYRASLLAGKETIPAIVKDIDDKETAKIALLENLQRKDLTPIEEARTYQTILKLDNLTQEELAASLGKSQSTIANKIRLLNLDEEVQTALLNQKISERHARSLLNIENKQDQRNMLEKVIMNRMTVKQLDEEIMRLTGKQVIDDVSEEDTPNNLNINNEKLEQKLPEMPINNNTQSEVQVPNQINDQNAQIPVNNQEATPKEPDENNIFKSIFDDNNKKEEQPNNVFESVFKDQNSNKEEAPNTLPKQDNIFAKLRVENKEEPIPTILPKVEKVEENGTMQTSINSQSEYGNIYDLRFAINNVRQAVQNTEKFGFSINVEEFDFENVYQIVIKIDKNK